MSSPEVFGHVEKLEWVAVFASGQDSIHIAASDISICTSPCTDYSMHVYLSKSLVNMDAMQQSMHTATH